MTSTKLFSYSPPSPLPFFQSVLPHQSLRHKRPISTVDTTDQQGVVTRRDEEVALADDGEVLCTFPVVDDAASINVRLSAIVENMSRSGEEQTLQASDCFVLNEMDTSSQVEDIYLRWNATDMQLMVVGKTG